MAVQEDVTDIEQYRLSSELNVITKEFLQYDDDPTQQIKLASVSGVKSFTIIFSASDNTSSIPKNPFQLKVQISNQISHYAQITNAINTKQGKLIIQTSGVEAAIEISQIREILGVPVSAKVPFEQVTSRFLIRDINLDFDLQLLVKEIESNGIFVNNVRRFYKKGSKDPSESVLVTTYGYQIPKEIRLFFSVIRIKKFIDSPRHCMKCFEFNHSTKACKLAEALCPNCGVKHLEECQSDHSICINCQGPATDKNCPTRIFEGKLLELKKDDELTFTEARRLFPTEDKISYTAVTAEVAPQSCDIEFIQDLITKFAEAFDARLEAKLETLSNSFDAKLEAMNNSFDAKLEAMNELSDAKLEALNNLFDAELKALNNLFNAKLKGMSNSFDVKLEDISNSFDAKLEDMSNSFDAKLETMRNSFDHKLSQLAELVDQISDIYSIPMSPQSTKRRSPRGI